MDNDTSDVTDNQDEIKRLSDSSCKNIIKNAVDANQTFTNVKKKFAFTNPKDNKVLLSYYTEILFKALPLKIKMMIDEIFNNFKEDLVVQWTHVVYNLRSNKSDLEMLIKNAPFYECLIDLRDNNSEVDFSTFYATLRNEFCSVFINFSNFTGILEIFQCLLRCKSLPSPNQSTLFCDTVKCFFRNKCNISDLDLEAEIEAKIDPEHFRLAKLVENFGDTSHTSIVNLIKDVFPSTNVFISNDGNKKVAKVEGYQVIWSKVYNKDPASFNSCDMVEIRAENELIIDDNVHLPGITFSLFALNVVVPKPVTINLSGISDYTRIPKAQNGVDAGEKGEDGKDGRAGQSSGNFALVSKTIQGMENLKLTLNGGKGTDGQAGGDGADGADGEGVEFENEFGTIQRLRTGVRQIVNLLTFGSLSRLVDKMIENQRDDGSFAFFNDSPFYFSTHSFSFIRGADGKPGGKGGKNGIGGQGGKKGKYNVIVNNKIENENIAVISNDGEKGCNGLPGINADYGTDGWDIAVMNSTFGERIEYGKERNEKLYFKYEETAVKNSVYLSDKKCYVTVKRQPCAKKRLKENEKRTEYKDESEINGESIAVGAIDIEISSLMEDYHAIVVSDEMIEEQQDVEDEMHEEMNVQRIMELWIDVKVEPYVPKKRHKTPLFPEDLLEGLFS
uniref:Uncharacterized protein n=1 Tax=Panagrolaimus davidi TaxID=227884 RepID=A0A914PTM1_9BILA